MNSSFPQKSKTILITLNGNKQVISPNLSIEDLVNLLKLDKNLIAVEVNGNIIRKNEYSSYKINENDEIEILTLIGGG
jgi:sulfur carrier protein